MALTSIIDLSNKVPRVFLKVTFGVGRRSAGAAPFRILLTGNKTASGTMAVETRYAVTSKEDVKTLAGAGSELHRMAIAIFDANPGATVEIIAITEAGTAATKTITFTGGPATATGSVSVWVLGEKIVVPVSIGDTITAVALAVSNAINDQTDWPVTASPSAGVVTVTAKNTGPRSNWISIRTLLEGGTGVAHTSVTGFMASGATLDVPTNALDAVDPIRYHLIVSPYHTATELSLYESHVNDGAEPIVGSRQRFVACSPDTLANTITLSDAVNAVRGELLLCPNPDSTPAEIAAAFAGAHAAKRSTKRSANTDGMRLPGIAPQFVDGDSLSGSEQNAALNNGITPLETRGGEVYMVRSVTNYHLDGSSNPDFSVIDSHYVEVPDFVADTLEINFASQWSGFAIGTDNDDGSPPGPEIATPDMVRDWVFGILKDQERAGLIRNVDALADSIIVEENGAVDGRMDASIPVEPVPLFHQFAADVRQTRA